MKDDSKVPGVRIDITSGVAESLIKGAKSFLGKIISPAAEEFGLTLQDSVRGWRLKRQLQLLAKTERYCNENNIMPKTISLKILCPLLDFASYEDDEYIHDKWAILLGNLIDSNQNIQDNVFPALLSQISRKEFEILQKVVVGGIESREKAKVEYEIFKTTYESKKEQYQLRRIEAQSQMQKLIAENKLVADHPELAQAMRKAEDDLKNLEDDYLQISKRTIAPIYFQGTELQLFEEENLKRLRVIVDISILESNNTFVSEIFFNMLSDISIPSSDFGLSTITKVTSLGELFIQATTEKRQ